MGRRKYGPVRLYSNLFIKTTPSLTIIFFDFRLLYWPFLGTLVKKTKHEKIPSSVFFRSAENSQDIDFGIAITLSVISVIIPFLTMIY